jgi:short-subunit dehydrogenase
MNIVITGASRGIGLAVAEAFAAAGHQLFLCSRKQAVLDAAAAQLRSAYPRCTVHVMAADMAVKSEVEAFAQWCLQQATPDIVVNNAGQFLPGSVHSEPDGVLETLMNANVYSAYHLSRALLPAMMRRKTGHIFNICSIASLQAYANGGAYSISKFALLGFSKNLREEMKPYGIKVSSVMPGAAYTDSWSDSGVDPKRIMEAADVAKMIVAAAALSPQAVMEDIVLRPQLGDL